MKKIWIKQIIFLFVAIVVVAVSFTLTDFLQQPEHPSETGRQLEQVEPPPEKTDAESQIPKEADEKEPNPEPQTEQHDPNSTESPVELPAKTTAPTKDEVAFLLGGLEQETGIDFSEIRDAEFKLVVKVDPEFTEETVAGKEFEVSGISSKQYDSIGNFLEDRGLMVDLNNTVDFTVSGIKGYKKDKTACVVEAGFVGYKEADDEWAPLSNDKWDTAVRCGKL